MPSPHLGLPSASTPPSPQTSVHCSVALQPTARERHSGAYRELGEDRPPKARDPRGVWEWEIDGAQEGVIRDGIIDVKWDVAQKS